MKLIDLTWTLYRLPFRAAFRTAHGTLSHRSGAIVTIRTDSGHVGNGEVAPLPTQSGRSLDETLNVLPGLARELRGREVAAILRFLETQNERLPSALLCGLETALLDAAGQADGQSIARLLASGYPREEKRLPTPPRTIVPVYALIGGETAERTIERARAALDAGYTSFKLKLTDPSDTEIERVAAIRASFGSGPRLRLDANESWNLSQAIRMLDRYAAYDIEYIEQPLPASELDQMAWLRRHSPIPIAADEALTGLASAQRILDARAADLLILKPQLAGGLQACRQIIRETSERGAACVITSTLEAGIGVAAALHLAAASPEITLPCGLATLDLLEDDLLQEGLPVEQGHLRVPPGPGLGVELDKSTSFLSGNDTTGGSIAQTHT